MDSKKKKKNQLSGLSLDAESAGILILDFSASRIVRNKFLLFVSYSVYSGGSDGLPAMQETWVQFLGREDPLEKEMATHSSTLARKFIGWRSLVGYSPWGRKQSDMTE